MTTEAAKNNVLVLNSFNFDINQALKAQAKSPIGYGSEFRKGEILFPLLQNHPVWPCLKNLLEFGSRLPTAPIS
jgi:hypothetical protein